MWGHTNINQCLFLICFMFVWPHVGSPLALRLLGVRCRTVSTRQMPVHDVHSIGPFLLVSSPTSQPRSRVTLNLLAVCSPGTLANYPPDFGKWKDFLVVSVVLLSIHYFLASAAYSSGWLTAVGRGDLATEACTLTTSPVARFGLRVSPTYSRLQTENELEGDPNFLSFVDPFHRSASTAFPLCHSSVL